MSLNAATIEFLLAKGLTGEDLLEVARRSEQRRDRTNADRQARHRAKKNGKSNGVTVTPVTPPNEYISNPPPSSPETKVSSDEGIVISGEMTAPPDENPIELKPEHVIEAYGELAERLGLPPIRKLTDTRQKCLRAFVRRNSIEEVQAALAAIERSAFLRGENERGWRADFDFLLQPKSFAKLIEGAYDH